MSEGSLIENYIDIDAPFAAWDSKLGILAVRRGPTPQQTQQERELRGPYVVVYIRSDNPAHKRTFWGVEFLGLPIALKKCTDVFELFPNAPRLSAGVLLHFLIRRKLYRTNTNTKFDWDMTVSQLLEYKIFVPRVYIHYFVTGSRRHLS